MICSYSSVAPPLGRPRTSRNSVSNSCVRQSSRRLSRTASRMREGLPRQRRPDTKVLVSTTAFTPAPVLPHGVHFGLDFLHAHRLPGLVSHLAQQVAEFLPRARALQ